MRPSVRLLAAALLIGPLTASPAAAQLVATTSQFSGGTTLDMNKLVSGSAVGNQLPGVSVSGACASSYFGFYFANDPMQATNFTGQCAANAGQAVTFSFLNPIVGFGFRDVTVFNGLTFTTNTGSVVAPFNANVFAMQAGWVGITSPTAFSSVTVQVQGDGLLAFDDVSYIAAPSFNSLVDVTATPEPASMTLLGTGLIGVFGAARRRLRNRDAA